MSVQLGHSCAAGQSRKISHTPFTAAMQPASSLHRHFACHRASKAHGGASAAGADQQLVQQAPATQASQDHRQSSSSGGHHGMLQEGAAAADQ